MLLQDSCYPVIDVGLLAAEPGERGAGQRWSAVPDIMGPSPPTVAYATWVRQTYFWQGRTGCVLGYAPPITPPPPPSLRAAYTLEKGVALHAIGVGVVMLCKCCAPQSKSRGTGQRRSAGNPCLLLSALSHNVFLKDMQPHDELG